MGTQILEVSRLVEFNSFIPQMDRIIDTEDIIMRDHRTFVDGHEVECYSVNDSFRLKRDGIIYTGCIGVVTVSGRPLGDDYLNKEFTNNAGQVAGIIIGKTQNCDTHKYAVAPIVPLGKTKDECLSALVKELAMER